MDHVFDVRSGYAIAPQFQCRSSTLILCLRERLPWLDHSRQNPLESIESLIGAKIEELNTVSGPNDPQRDLKAELDDALHRSEELLRRTDRLLEQYRELLERGQQIIDQSHKVMSKLNRDR